MAAVPENGTTGIPTGSPAVDNNVKFGFKRPEMHTEELSGDKAVLLGPRHIPCGLLTSKNLQIYLQIVAWYGYVTPSDVPDLLDNHIGKGEIIDRIWRGQMGVPVKKAQKALEHSLSNGNDVTIIKPDHQASSTIEEKENNGGCCQGANGISCCRDEPPRTETDEVNKAISKFNILTTKWEKHEVFTAAAIVGAVVTIAVAYSFYKRLR
ncbi:hypothetical protein E3N88_30308 [Mikania micrantha]|uniref:Uncharacterized protein n=1 Tax=Mikania micrantha TaxID=192012 RepID=A0A5N6MP64_9ASTR|nr:hypothetical protein E3N88_30308 [Mikania micrantha]